MKIISIGLYNPLPINSGVDSYISYLLSPLGKKNDVVHYYFVPSKNKKGHYPTEINFQTKYLETVFFTKFKHLPKMVQLLRPDLIIDKRSLKNITSDIVICDTTTFHAAHYVSRKNKSPLIMIKHNIEWKYLQDDGSFLYLFLKAYEHYTLQKAAAIITISMSDYRYIYSYVDEERIFYIPPTINANMFKPDGDSFNYGDDKLNLLFYGSLDRTMNIDALIFIKNNLIPELQQEHLLESVRINIFGSGTPPTYLKLAQDKSINYLGSVDNPGTYIRGADLVLVPLKNAGGMKIRLLETLFCGKPVIATPEAVVGLPDELKKMVYVESDAKGFVKIIKSFINGGEKSKIDMQIIKTHMSKNTMEDVIKWIVSNL